MNNKSEMLDDLENSQETMGRVAKDLGKQTKRFVKDKQEDFKDMTNAYCDHVREHPMRSVLLGVAAGILLSKIFSKLGN